MTCTESDLLVNTRDVTADEVNAVSLIASGRSLLSSKGFAPDPDPESFTARLLDSLYDGVYFVDADRRITYWNQGAERLTGYSSNEAVGKKCFDNFLMHVDEAGCALCLAGCPLRRTITDGSRHEVELFLRHKQGHRVPVSVRASPIEAKDGSIIGAVEIFSDISAMKKLQRKAGELECLAYKDTLTGLMNRRFTELKVQQAIQEVNAFNRNSGIILIDVDHFKFVNDRYGHQVGDLVLKAIGTTLANSVLPGDIVGRWGGDEFLVIMRDVTAESLEQLTERCRKFLGESSVLVEESIVRIQASLGATLLRDGDTSDLAFERADRLMYKSKIAGGNCIGVG
jgi:diguanylate cyclase (GGDEF)-like protein/PAS domain S-box-containing protein